MGWRNPLQTTEFEIHAEAYLQLKRYFHTVKGEYHFKDSTGKKAARFDVAILDRDKKIYAIVEVKRANKKDFRKQVRRYQDLTGRPVAVVAGMDQALYAVSAVFGATGMPDGSHPDVYHNKDQMAVRQEFYREFGKRTLIIPLEY